MIECKQGSKIFMFSLFSKIKKKIMRITAKKLKINKKSVDKLKKL